MKKKGRTANKGEVEKAVIFKNFFALVFINKAKCDQVFDHIIWKGGTSMDHNRNLTDKRIFQYVRSGRDQWNSLWAVKELIETISEL